MKTRLLIFAFLFCASIAAQTCTTVVGTIKNPDLTPFNGTVSAEMRYSSAPGGQQLIAQGKVTVTVKGGAFRKCLYQGNFIITYQPDGYSQYERYWQVPSGSQTNIGDIETSIQVTPTLRIPYGSVTPPGSNGSYIFNDAGTLGASGASWAKSTNMQTVAGNLYVTNAGSTGFTQIGVAPPNIPQVITIYDNLLVSNFQTHGMVCTNFNYPTGICSAYQAGSDSPNNAFGRGMFVVGEVGGAGVGVTATGIAASAVTDTSMTGASTQSSTRTGGGLRNLFLFDHFGSGTVTLATAVVCLGRSYTGSGAITDAAGCYAGVPSSQSGNSWGTYSSFWARGGVVTGNIGTWYGSRIDPIKTVSQNASTVANSWAYFAQSDPSFFGGPVSVAASSSAGIGVTPQFGVDVGLSGPQGTIRCMDQTATIGQTYCLDQGGPGQGTQHIREWKTFAGVSGGYIEYDGSFHQNALAVFGGALRSTALHSTTGTRYLCVDTAGNFAASATACSGT